MMESNLECITSIDGMDGDEISYTHFFSQFSSPKFSPNSINISGLNGGVVNPPPSVYELLACPVCTNSMYPPIHQCLNGHTLGSTCKVRVHNRCPTCRQELGDIRCLALKKWQNHLSSLASIGCPEIFPYYRKLKHETICNFRPNTCPYAGSECFVVGDILFLVSHLRDDHKDFCLHFEAFQLGMTPVYMAFLCYMGDEMEARNYSYSLEVGGNGRKVTWEGMPRSIRDGHRKVRDSHDGLIIQRNMALFFSEGDRKELKLRVICRIWKEQQNPDDTCIPNLI